MVLCGLVVVEGSIGLHIFVRFVLGCSCVAYVIIPWLISSHDEHIVKFWCEGEVPIYIFFGKF